MNLDDAVYAYKTSGRSLKQRSTPQPSQPGSWEYQLVGAIRNCNDITIPKSDPIFLSFKFYMPSSQVS